MNPSLTPQVLDQASIQIILANQHPSGAYIASPTFPTYHYCWFRDASFVAYAMDLSGHSESAKRFHAWSTQAVLRRTEIIERALQKCAQGQTLAPEDQLHTRYTLDGEDGTREEWPNFQLDGFGTWLWALSEHQKMSGAALPAGWRRAVELTAAYLSALWQTPCFDCWEEFPEQVHPHTLAAIYGGLAAAQELCGLNTSATRNSIRDFVLTHCVSDGHFVKYPGVQQVDASLLGLSTPYRLVEPSDPLMVATVARIEQDLLSGGVHRYTTDTYYGGGEWVLLTAWLGWYETQVGQMDKAQKLAAWILAQANQQGELPEQVHQALNDPAYLKPWIQRWGPAASPLLWSQAKWLILSRALGYTPHS